ncbi:unnamed protein product, partial [Durusdinium trenchii]
YGAGCILACGIGARTNRIKLSPLALLTGDMCAAFTYQSDCQQREDLSYLQGFTSKLAYNFQ